MLLSEVPDVGGLLQAPTAADVLTGPLGSRTVQTRSSAALNGSLQSILGGTSGIDNAPGTGDQESEGDADQHMASANLDAARFSGRQGTSMASQDRRSYDTGASGDVRSGLQGVVGQLERVLADRGRALKVAIPEFMPNGATKAKARARAEADGIG